MSARNSRTVRWRWCKLLVAVSAWVLFAGAAPALAQLGGGRGGQGGGHKPPPKRNPKKDSPSGSEKGWLVKFKPAKEDAEDEDLLGVLMVKGFEKHSKVVKMIVHLTDELKIQVSDHTFDPDELGDVLWKGLYCTASWKLKETDSRRKPKELQTLSFDTLQLEGKVYEIGDGMVILKAVPRNGRQWPDVEAKGKSSPGRRSDTKAKRIVRRKVKLKVIEDLSKFQDASDEEMSLDDFEVGQEIEATIVFGRPYGMVVAMRIPSDGSGANKPDRGQPPEGDGRPGPRGGGGGAGPVGGGRGGRGG